jgi:hypothetical protein
VDLQDPLANAGAGKGINEDAAEITDGKPKFDSSSERGAGPLPAEASASSAAGAKIRGSSTSSGDATGNLAGIADAAAAGQAGGLKSASNADSGQRDAAQAKRSDAAPVQAVTRGATASGPSAVRKQAEALAANVSS